MKQNYQAMGWRQLERRAADEMHIMVVVVVVV